MAILRPKIVSDNIYIYKRLSATTNSVFEFSIVFKTDSCHLLFKYS
jgi:hypothetical protein